MAKRQRSDHNNRNKDEDKRGLKKILKRRRVSFGELPRKTVEGDEGNDEGDYKIPVKIRVTDGTFDEDKQQGRINKASGRQGRTGRKEKGSETTQKRKKSRSKPEPKRKENTEEDESDAEEDEEISKDKWKDKLSAVCSLDTGTVDDDGSGSESEEALRDSESGSEYPTSGDSSEEESTDKKEGDEGSEWRADKPCSVANFEDMRLDARVTRGIERMGFKTPTPVQSAVIPAALRGRDVLATAPTGSGKTAAFAIPILQRLCAVSRSKDANTSVRAAVLVPTRELAHQTTKMIRSLGKFIDGLHVSTVGKLNKNAEGADGAFDFTADVIVGTPAAVAAVANVRRDALSAIEFTVIDEADLVLSYGYEAETRQALVAIPSSAQTLLVSATLDADGIDDLRAVVLRNPVAVEVSAADNFEKQGSAKHHYARLKSAKDRYLVTYAMLRLKVITGKVLVFVSSINSAFRLKLFLDHFKVRSAVLNSELPANARLHCVEQFNRGLIDVLVATDEAHRTDTSTDGIAKTAGNIEGQQSTRKQQPKRKKDDHFGLSRGLDFRNASAVINFDVPESKKAYIHRAGRTARAGTRGTVLTLILNKEQADNVEEYCKQIGTTASPLAFRMDQIEAFRYRVEDSLHSVGASTVKAARLADIKKEIVNSERLANYFEENPQDLNALKHDMPLAPNRQSHLAHIPHYLLPSALRGSINKERMGSARRRSRTRKFEKKGKQNDPLRSMSVGNPSSRDRWQSLHKVKRKKRLSRKSGVDGQYLT